MKLSSNSANFLYSWSVLPNAELKDITIKDSRNANILLMGLDTVNISNLYSERTSVQDVKLPLPLLTFIRGHSVTAYNVTAKDVYGPVLATQDVMKQNFTDCTFSNMSSSQSLIGNHQNILLILNTNDPGTLGLNPNNPMNIYVNNFNLNVIHAVGAPLVLPWWIGLYWHWRNKLSKELK